MPQDVKTDFQLEERFYLYIISCHCVFFSVLPLLRESIGILMQRTPSSLDHVLPTCYQRVSSACSDLGFMRLRAF